MIYFSLGLPSRLAQWCEVAIEKLLTHNAETAARISYPPHGAIPTPSDNSKVLNDAASCLVLTNAFNLVVGAHEPDEQLKQLLIESRTPFIMALDDPRAVVADLCDQGGYDVKTATRAIAHACPFVLECLDLPRSLAIRTADLGDKGYATLMEIAKHLDIPLEDLAARDIAAGLAELLPSQQCWNTRIPAESHKMVSGALGAYSARFHDGTLDDLIWARDLFFLGADASRALNAPIQLREVGNGLIIVYGPYIGLPSGYWTAKIIIGFSPETIGQTFTFDVYCVQQLAVKQFTPRTAGVFTIELDFAINEVAGKMVEIHVIAGRHSAPGELAFGQAMMHPIALRQQNHISERQGDYRAVLEE